LERLINDRSLILIDEILVAGTFVKSRITAVKCACNAKYPSGGSNPPLLHQISSNGNAIEARTSRLAASVADGLAAMLGFEHR